MGLPPSDAPPSYTEATTTTSPIPSSSSPSSSQYNNNPLGPSPLTTHLRTLPARLAHSHLARQTVQASHDLDLTSLLVPHVEAFLVGLTTSGPGGSLSSATRRGAGGMRAGVAELTLVPASAVPAGWAMSGVGERRAEGEVVVVRRVDVAGLVGDDDDDEGGEKKGREAKGRGFGREEEDDDDYGRASASRSAGFDEWAASTRTIARGEANPGRRREGGAEQAPPLVPPPVSPPGLGSAGSGAEDDSVKMTVRAEEVTFRKENAFGVWESKSGWGIVVTVRVKP
ncbi:hypothetical protein NEMBOFW57_009393 [Staphylotrichum longicolle]|uniref:Uncharacterized protein n=1 Tax=Staphylotrichum longicolle TaxID=669026 RepID=A0AAD4EPA5_9PEZI|nr:hypothetical protein NEMBOFW57_009393 [Staphylotrichum longicolle]